MTDLTASLVISLRNERFRAGLREAGVDVQTFSRQSRQELRTVRSEFQSLTGRGLGQLRNELMTLAGGFAAASAAADSARLDKSLTEIGLGAGASKEQIKELRGELFELQKTSGIVVADTQSAAASLLASGLAWDQARGATKAISPASTVTNARPDILAGALSVTGEIFKYDLSEVKTATDLLDKMTVAGRLGNAELENLSSIFARVGGNAKRAGMGFEQSLGFIEQLSLIEKQPERLATLADSTLRIFTNANYQKAVEDKLGINFYDQSGNRKDSFDVIDDISNVYQLQKNDRQRDALVAAAFGHADLDTQRGIQALLQTGKIDEARDKTRQILAANGTIARELDDAMNNAVIQGSRLKGVLRESIDGFMGGINRGFVDITKYLLDDKKDGGLGLDGDHLFAGGAAALAGGYGAYKYGGPMIKKALGGMGSLAGGVAVGAALEATVGVTPVYVVNMPNGITPIDGIGGRRGLPGGPGTSRHTGLGRGTPTPGLPRPGLGAPPVPPAGGAAALGAASMLGWGAVAGAAGYGAGTLINDYLIDGTEVGKEVGNAIGRSVAFLMAGLGSDAAERALEAEVSQRYRASQNTSSEEKAARLKIEIAEDRTLVKELEATGLYVDVSGMMMVNP